MTAPPIETDSEVPQVIDEQRIDIFVNSDPLVDHCEGTFATKRPYTIDREEGNGKSVWNQAALNRARIRKTADIPTEMRRGSVHTLCPGRPL